MRFRYPIRYEHDPEFIQRLCKYIANDLSDPLNTTYEEIKETTNSYYIDLIDNKLNFVDKAEFHEREKEDRRLFFENEGFK